MLDNNMDFVDEFEKKLARYLGVGYAVCTDCCTNAIAVSMHMKRVMGLVSERLSVPSRTYMSVPMTLTLHGFDVSLDNRSWVGKYDIRDLGYRQSTGIHDCAVFFFENMWKSAGFGMDDLACISFQQKKRLNLGRGGAILTDNRDWWLVLKRLSYDGRDPRISDVVEVSRCESPDDIPVGFHSYMEPEKAARGIAILNQPSTMRPYVELNSSDYADLTRLGHWQTV